MAPIKCVDIDAKAFREALAKYLDDVGLTYKGKQIDQFTFFYEALIEKNKVMNLTALTDPKEVALKHMVDSLAAYDKTYFKEGAKVIDIGTGAGFPGIPLAIYDETLEITLFDSLQKRLTFLEEVIEGLGMKGRLNTVHGRAEERAHQSDLREAYDVGTSRAVARLPILLEWSLPFIKEKGYFVALKGAQYKEEVDESTKALQVLGGTMAEVRPIHLPTIDDKRAILYVKKEGTTPKKYPRKPKEIKDKPLV